MGFADEASTYEDSKIERADKEKQGDKKCHITKTSVINWGAHGEMKVQGLLFRS